MKRPTREQVFRDVAPALALLLREQAEREAETEKDAAA